MNFPHLLFHYCFFPGVSLVVLGSSRVLVALLEKQLAWLPESPYSTFLQCFVFSSNSQRCIILMKNYVILDVAQRKRILTFESAR